MLQLIRKNQQVFIVFIILYCFTTVITCFAFAYAHQDLHSFFSLTVYANFGKYIYKVPFLGFILAFSTIIGLLFAGFYLVRININYLIIQKRTQFPAIFLITITSFSFHNLIFTSALIGSLFLLMATDRVFSSIEKESPSLRFFDAGILISLGSLFYFNLIFYIPFFMIAQFTLKQFNWKEFLYPLIGLIVPFIYIFSGCFFFNHPITGDLKFAFSQMFFSKAKLVYNWPFIAGLAIYLLLFIIANFFIIKKYTTTKVQSRKFYQVLFYLFVMALAVYIFVPSAGTEIFYFISIPVSVLLSIYFSECRNNLFNKVIFILAIMTPLVVNILEAIKNKGC